MSEENAQEGKPEVEAQPQAENQEPQALAQEGEQKPVDENAPVPKTPEVKTQEEIKEKPKKEVKIMEEPVENPVIEKGKVPSEEFTEEELEQIMTVKKHNSIKNGVFSIIATLIQKIGIGSIFILLNLSTYLISYLIHFEKKKSLTLSYSYWFSPVLSIAMSIFMPMVGIIELKFGIKYSLLLSASINISASFLMYVSKNFYIDTFALLLFSAGFSIGVIIMSKNVSMFFFNKKGTIAGLLDLVSSLFNGVYNKIGEELINPAHDEVTEDFYYEYEVSRNILKFFLFQMIVFAVSTLIAFFLVVPFDLEGAEKLRKIKKRKMLAKKGKGKKKEKVDDEKKQTLLPSEEEEKIVQSKEIKEDEEGKYEVKNSKEQDEAEEAEKIQKEKEEEKKQEEKKVFEEVGHIENTPMIGNISVLGKTFEAGDRGKKIKKALRSLRVMRLFFMNICSFPINNLIMMTWRPVGLYKGINTKLVQTIGSFTFIATSLATPLFGFLADRVQYRFLYIILAGTSSLCGFLFFFSFSHEYLFSIIVLTINFIMGATIQIGPPHYMNVFGMRYFIEISGFIGISRAILSPACSSFAFFIERGIKNRDLAYKIIYNGSAALNIIAIILAIFEGENEFDYDA